MDHEAVNEAQGPTPLDIHEPVSFGYSRWYVWAVLLLTLFLYGLLLLPRSPFNYSHELDIYLSEIGEGRRARPNREQIVPLVERLEQHSGSEVTMTLVVGDDAAAIVRVDARGTSAAAARASAYLAADQLLDQVDGRDSDAQTLRQLLAVAESAEARAWQALQDRLADHLRSLDETARQLAEFYVSVNDDVAARPRPSSQLNDRWVAANENLDDLYRERDRLLRLFPASHPRVRDVGQRIERLHADSSSIALLPPGNQEDAGHAEQRSPADASLSRIADFGPDFHDLVARYRESRNEVRRLNAIGMPLSQGGLVGWTVDAGTTSELRGRLPALLVSAAALATLLTIWIWKLAAPGRLAETEELTRLAPVPVWTAVMLGPPRLTASLARRRQLARRWLLATHLMLFVYVAAFVILSSIDRPLTWRIFIDPWI